MSETSSRKVICKLNINFQGQVQKPGERITDDRHCAKPRPLCAILLDMQKIIVHVDDHDFNLQLSHLIRLEFRSFFKSIRSYLLFILGATSVAALIWIIPSEYLVTPKAVSLIMLGIIWGAAIIFGVILLCRYLLRLRWKAKTLKTVRNDPQLSTYQMSFNDEGLYFESRSYESNIKWNYFSFWDVRKNSVFLIPENNLYGAFMCSKNEIGEPGYIALEEYVSEKLKKFE